MYFILATIVAVLGAAVIDSSGLTAAVFFALAAGFVAIGVIRTKRNRARPRGRWWAGGNGGGSDDGGGCGGGSDGSCGGGSGCGGGGD
ncbi:hypothetical protein [Nocardia sp. bgisy118]|uniref:hypothetical protein n=1 Tax=Nocardia sp. bgisy118 TaxID=3413786 RepID=UPI003F4A5E39